MSVKQEFLTKFLFKVRTLVRTFVKEKEEVIMKRPQIHFTPFAHWMNDPNGLVYIKGTYHLFYQYYPKDIVWGPMHWGHAVSKDLLYWEHKEIALYPDKLGYIFSGSCIYDEENVSGLGRTEQPPLIAFFTSHNPENGQEQQSIAYSLDLEHFIKYEGNPVIPNSTKKDFRDPKVFPNPIKGGFTMVVAAGNEVEFYYSKNLLEWEKTGAFVPGECGYGGLCECPDCFSLEAEEGTKWILTISMCLMEEKAGMRPEQGGFGNVHVMQYYVGEFDGETFTDIQKAKEPLVLDYGTDNYAAVTFANHKERIMLGWGENWDYVSDTPAEDYRGKMTLGRKLAVRKTQQGLRLQNEPISREGIENIVFDRERTNLPSGKCYRMNVTIDVGEMLVFSNENGERFAIRVKENEIIVDRSQSGGYGFSERLKEDRYHILSASRMIKGKSKIELIYDEGYFEIFADEGLLPFSVMTYSTQTYTMASLHKI